MVFYSTLRLLPHSTLLGCHHIVITIERSSKKLPAHPPSTLTLATAPEGERLPLSCFSLSLSPNRVSFWSKRLNNTTGWPFHFEEGPHSLQDLQIPTCPGGSQVLRLHYLLFLPCPSQSSPLVSWLFFEHPQCIEGLYPIPLPVARPQIVTHVLTSQWGLPH